LTDLTWHKTLVPISPDIDRFSISFQWQTRRTTCKKWSSKFAPHLKVVAA